MKKYIEYAQNFPFPIDKRGKAGYNKTTKIKR